MIRVVCRADRFNDTVRMLSWAIGHPITFADPPLTAITRCLFVQTDLEYGDGDEEETVLKNLGLNAVGMVAGVLSWSVTTSDAETA